jgi:hypothetical protein
MATTTSYEREHNIPPHRKLRSLPPITREILHPTPQTLPQSLNQHTPSHKEHISAENTEQRRLNRMRERVEKRLHKQQLQEVMLRSSEANDKLDERKSGRKQRFSKRIRRHDTVGSNLHNDDLDTQGNTYNSTYNGDNAQSRLQPSEEGLPNFDDRLQTVNMPTENYSKKTEQIDTNLNISGESEAGVPRSNFKNQFHHKANEISNVPVGPAIINHDKQPTEIGVLTSQIDEYEEIKAGEIPSTSTPITRPYSPHEPPTNVFVENTTTGKFKRMDQLQSHEREQRVKDTQEDTGIQNVSLRQLADWGVATLGCVFLIAQGLLGGFALLHFYLSYIDAYTSRPTHFLHYYSVVAQASQHTYFTLGTVGLLAACDRYSKDHLQHAHRGRGGVMYTLPFRKHILDIILIMCYGLVFLSTLVNAPMDDALHYAAVRSTGWSWDGDEFIDNLLHGPLQQWHIFNGLRAVCAILSWLLVVATGTTVVTA